MPENNSSSKSAFAPKDSILDNKQKWARNHTQGANSHRGRGPRELIGDGGRVSHHGGRRTSVEEGNRHNRKRNNEKGRAEWSRDRFLNKGRNDRNKEERAGKRRKVFDAGEHPFSKEEIAREERKPKRKVAVLIGYAGTGYKGMQINDTEKTIEGDLFTAFVKAGAISKANADDPKKSSLVRCARTDKGVHAAGNVISLKLIVEDPDVVEKINEALPSQIRVWGYERTNGAFSCYQTCDSRWYEYLIPTYSFLPPHPKSFLGSKLLQSALEEGKLEDYHARQRDVDGFWSEAEEFRVRPILERLDPEVRAAVIEAIYNANEESESFASGILRDVNQGRQTELDQALQTRVQDNQSKDLPLDDKNVKTSSVSGNNFIHSEISNEISTSSLDRRSETEQSKTQEMRNIEVHDSIDSHKSTPLSSFENAIKEVKAAFVAAKKAYRISDFRRERLQESLNVYLGTQNFHNYTVQKGANDPSAKRHIKSFVVGKNSIIIDHTEWLSMKVHGQSFMMHQIRKMVAMAALIVRCGCSVDLIRQSFGPKKISIPKAPGLGLLLERPIFDSYNKRAAEELQRESLDFVKYENEIEDFKQREIYARIFRTESTENQFHAFFHHLDHIPTGHFLWVTAKGITAAHQAVDEGYLKPGAIISDMDSEDEANSGGMEDG